MSRFIDIHTHKSNADSETIEIINVRVGHECIPAGNTLYSAGIHPWDVPNNSSIDSLKQVENADCLTIGEIGLDKCCTVPLEQQMTVFEAQLRIAECRQLPIIIHCVRAYNEVLAELRKHKLKAVIFHGFTGSYELTREIIRQGYYLSFGPGALKNTKGRSAICSCPNDKLFIETDESEEPIANLYAEVATLKGVDTEEIKRQLEINFTNIFHNL
ncbi:MAG: TatD family hydrolase [Tidjanibacter sp.]|nr:TatD family hydrolase [Tidjanibacter sp.]